MNKKNFTIFKTVLFLSVVFVVSCNKDHSGLTQINVKEGTFTKNLSIPAEVSANNLILNADETSIDLLGGMTRVLGYNGNILGPTIHMNSGENASISFNNQLSESSNIHWHGLVIPAEMDGHPGDMVSAGSNFQYSFAVAQRAGTYWYHPHIHGKTSEQITKGLSGFFIVNDAEEAALNLPSGTFEIPMVIQDKRFKNGKDIDYSPTPMDIMSGYFGDHILVNGVYAPVQKVSSKWYRLRLLNGSSARVYNIALSDGAPLIVIGSDGGLLRNPESVQSLLLSPGERADILIDFTKYALGTEIFLQSNTFNGGIQGKQAFKISKFIIDKLESDNFVLPSTLSNYITLPGNASSKTRIFDIANAGHGGGHGGHGGSGHTINNQTFDMDRIDETVKNGDIEIWVFDNSKGDDLHPMHMHGIQFQVLKREGGRGILAATEKGWKDTVLCLPGEKVSVIMAFPNHKGKFVFHCHNLEHEDDGMMLNYLIN